MRTGCRVWAVVLGRGGSGVEGAGSAGEADSADRDRDAHSSHHAGLVSTRPGGTW